MRTLHHLHTAFYRGDFTISSGVLEGEGFAPVDGPQQVSVELRPLSSPSWLYVQGLAQNPRLRLVHVGVEAVNEALIRFVYTFIQILCLNHQLLMSMQGDAEFLQDSC